MQNLRTLSFADKFLVGCHNDPVIDSTLPRTENATGYDSLKGEADASVRHGVYRSIWV